MPVESASMPVASTQTVTTSADGWTTDSASIAPDEVTGRTSEPETDPADTSADETETPAAPVKPVAAKPAEPQQPVKSKQTLTQRTAVLKAEMAAALKERHDAREAAAQARAELADLQRQRDAFRAERQPQRPQERPPARQDSALGPKPEWEAYDQAGKTWKEYEAAKDAWLEARAEEKAATRIKAEIASIDERTKTDRQRARDAEVTRAYAAKMEATEAKYPDFASLVDANLAGVGTTDFMKAILKYHEQGGEVLYHWARNPHEAEILATLQPTRPIMDAVATEKNPIPLLSYFAAHRAEYVALTQMPPAQQLITLGELRADLRREGARSTSDPPSKPSVQTTAPPFRTIGGTAAAGDEAPSGSSDDFAAWVRAENKRQSVREARRR